MLRNAEGNGEPQVIFMRELREYQVTVKLKNRREKGEETKKEAGQPEILRINGQG